jgi:hypothetical protein
VSKDVTEVGEGGEHGCALHVLLRSVDFLAVDADVYAAEEAHVELPLLLFLPPFQSSLTASRSKTISSAYESALLARLAAASLLSSALSRKQLETHKNLGFEWRDEVYVRMLRTFVFANVAAASILLCSTIIVSSVLLAGSSTSTQLRQGIFMVSFRPPLLQNLTCTRPALLYSFCVTFLSILIGFGVDSSS